MEPELETIYPGEDNTVLRPTHRLRNVTAGENSVQLLISTKDHVYDADTVEVGGTSWQVVGAWEESSLAELSKMLAQREIQSTEGSTGGRAFGTRYGGGQKLGPSKPGKDTDSK